MWRTSLKWTCRAECERREVGVRGQGSRLAAARHSLRPTPMHVRHAPRSLSRHAGSLNQRRTLKIPSLAAIRAEATPADPLPPTRPRGSPAQWTVLMRELGSYEDQVRREYGEPLDAGEQKRAVWADPYGSCCPISRADSFLIKRTLEPVRMLQGAPSFCAATFHALPPSALPVLAR
jgi:hypothetical protein